MKRKEPYGPTIPPEGERVELKQSLGEWKEIVETCAAFATAKGGRLYIGIANDGGVVGLQIGKGTLEDLTNKIAQNTSPKIVATVATVAKRGKTVIMLDVPENPIKPVYAFEKPLRRSGRTNQILSPTEAAELYMATRGITWDETILSDASFRDINTAKVRSFLRRAHSERRLNADADMSAEQALRQLNLLRDDKVKIAAILLFGKDPERLLPQSALRCARFKGDDTVHFLDMKVIDGTVIDQVEDALAFVRRNTSMAVKIEGKLERIERWEYPPDAVREAITNAVCHRDYADTGNVQVRVFDHSLEVWNPGALPAGLTVEDLHRNHESKPRNKVIARALFLIRYIEQFGTGTKRMIEECRRAGIPDPQFESRAGSFRVIFQKNVSVEQRFVGLSLNERQLSGLRYLQDKGRITKHEYVRLASTTDVTAKRDLADLVRKGVLVRKGATRSACYLLSGATNPPNDPKMTRK